MFNISQLLSILFETKNNKSFSALHVLLNKFSYQ